MFFGKVYRCIYIYIQYIYIYRLYTGMLCYVISCTSCNVNVHVNVNVYVNVNVDVNVDVNVNVHVNVNVMQ